MWINGITKSDSLNAISFIRIKWMNSRTKCSFNWLKHKTKNTLGHLENFFYQKRPETLSGYKMFLLYLTFQRLLSVLVEEKEKVGRWWKQNTLRIFSTRRSFLLQKKKQECRLDWNKLIHIPTRKWRRRRRCDDEQHFETTDTRYYFHSIRSLSLSLSHPLFLSPSLLYTFSLSLSLPLSLSLSHPLSQRWRRRRHSQLRWTNLFYFFPPSKNRLLLFSALSFFFIKSRRNILHLAAVIYLFRDISLFFFYFNLPLSRPRACLVKL